MTTTFLCQRLGCSLSEAACGARFERAARDAKLQHPRAMASLWGSPCLRCPTGEKNAVQAGDLYRRGKARTTERR